MSVKRHIFDTFVNAVAYCSLRQRAKDDTLFDYAKAKGIPLCLITISFDNVFVVEQQIRLIKRHITDRNYIHIVADNSTNTANRQAIKELCHRKQTGYIGLPYNFFQTTMYRPSYAHGLCMTWLYYNVVRRIEPRIFGFLDHDMFPLADCSITDKCGDRNFWGKLVDRTPSNSQERLWYLWAGFCFFRFERIDKMNPSFFPAKVNGVYLDTAGSLFRTLYRYHNPSEFSLAAITREECFRGGGNDYHSDRIHFIDNDWVHTVNASNWTGGKSKDDFLKDFLAKY